MFPQVFRTDPFPRHRFRLRTLGAAANSALAPEENESVFSFLSLCPLTCSLRSSNKPGLSQPQGLCARFLCRERSFLRCAHHTPSLIQARLHITSASCFRKPAPHAPPAIPTPLARFISLCCPCRCLAFYHCARTCCSLPHFPL